MAQHNAWSERKVDLAEAPYPHMKVRSESAFSPKPLIDITAYTDELAAVVVKTKIGASETILFLTRDQARTLGAALVDAVAEAEKREAVAERIETEIGTLPVVPA